MPELDYHIRHVHVFVACSTFHWSRSNSRTDSVVNYFSKGKRYTVNDSKCPFQLWRHDSDWNGVTLTIALLDRDACSRFRSLAVFQHDCACHIDASPRLTTRTIFFFHFSTRNCFPCLRHISCLSTPAIKKLLHLFGLDLCLKIMHSSHHSFSGILSQSADFHISGNKQALSLFTFNSITQDFGHHEDCGLVKQ